MRAYESATAKIWIENDPATDLNHTWFRKNENRAGRWTSPDPYNGSASIGNPQSWNRYSYVENEPTNLTDPSGLFVDSQESQGYCVRYHYSNPSTGEGFWGPWQCVTTSIGGNPGVDNAVNEAKELLKYKPCADLFGGKDAVKNLNTMAAKIQVTTSVPNVRGTAPGQYRITGYSGFGNNVAITVYSSWTTAGGKTTTTNVGVYIDANGQFFTNSEDITIYSGSQTIVTAEQRNAMTILHELMHWNGNRQGGPGHNATFNQKIYDKCIKSNPYYSTDPPKGPPGNTA